MLTNIMDTLAGIRERIISILLVEQNAEESLRIADYIYVPETGRIVLSGKAFDLQTDEKVKQRYPGA
jgi:branched-chain amino acid transport system ATP-binding protein